MISNILFKGANSGETVFFEDFILNSTHIAFGSKIKLFRSLYKTYSFLKEKTDARLCSSTFPVEASIFMFKVLKASVT